MRGGWLGLMLVIGACRFDHGEPEVTGDSGLVDDGDIPGDVVAIPPDAQIDEVVVTLAANNDDALQDPPPGAVLVSYSWMSLYTADHWGAMRFALPQVPRGATVVDAYLDVYLDTGATEDDPNVSITSEASANPAALMSLNNNISNRPRGTARVAWVATNLGTGMRRSPSLAAIVQERIDAAGWMTGQPILFIFDTVGPSFEVRQRDHAPAGMYAPKLTVRFIRP
ncbi:MAG TPA: hypothetical protein VIV11_12105 [Kofleriaceae bacterium]